MTIPTRYTIAERKAWLAGADAQIAGQARRQNPHSEQDGDLAEVLALAWWKGWDDTQAIEYPSAKGGV